MLPYHSKHGSMYFNAGFNKPLNKTALGRIAKNTWVYFNDEFNQSIDEIDGRTMFLKLGRDFNQPIGRTRHFLRGITFGSRYNQHIENITKQLAFITFGKDFNHPIDSLGDWIKEIEIGELDGSDFIHPINNLSCNLLIFILRAGPAFDESINFERASSLKKIIFGGYFNQLVIGENYEIQEIDEEETNDEIDKISEQINTNTRISQVSPVIQIPNVFFLCLGSNYTQTLDFLPDSIQFLFIGYDYGKWEDRIDPPTYPEKYFRRLSTELDISTITKLPTSLRSLRIATSEENLIELRKRFPNVHIGNPEYINIEIQQFQDSSNFP